MEASLFILQKHLRGLTWSVPFIRAASVTSQNYLLRQNIDGLRSRQSYHICSYKCRIDVTFIALLIHGIAPCHPLNISKLASPELV